LTIKGNTRLTNLSDSKNKSMLAQPILCSHASGGLKSQCDGFLFVYHASIIP